VYVGLANQLPASECLKDVVDRVVSAACLGDAEAVAAAAAAVAAQAGTT
jgi:hypothetical protein